MEHICAVCRNPAEKKCAGCAIPWYCGKKCQEYHWIVHIFDCNVKRRINTADHLALAVRRNRLPQDSQTRDDYGFSRLAFDLSSESNLLGLYIGLIERLEVKPKTINKWKQNGTLIQDIKNSFEQLPSHSRGNYYPWFLENLWIFSAPTESQAKEAYKQARDNILKNSWKYSGGSPTATAEQIKDNIQQLSNHKRQCLSFCGSILNEQHPSPLQDIWIPFGFCTCDEESRSDVHLGETYQKLLQLCTFDEFLAAYESSKLMELFKSKGLGPEISEVPFIEGVLDKTPYTNLSVWDLKQIILASEMADKLFFPFKPSLCFDYGFVNCRNDEETEDLKAVYKAYFARHDANPPALHEACIKGELVEYIDKFVKLKGKKKYRRLMKNMYPLPNI